MCSYNVRITWPKLATGRRGARIASCVVDTKTLTNNLDTLRRTAQPASPAVYFGSADSWLVHSISIVWACMSHGCDCILIAEIGAGE